jgi:succinate dehydrogenase / fumarate reductase, membrane anchor subunit
MVNRVVVGAHYGLRGWLVQRMTAVVMTVYVLFLAIACLARRPMDFGAWHGLFSGAPMRIFTMLFVVSLCLHAWVGVRDILMDYVKPTGIRLLLESLTVVVLVTYGLWAGTILWGI